MANTYPVQSLERVIGLGGFMVVFAAMSGLILGAGIRWLLGVVAVVVTGAVFWVIVLDEIFEIRLAKDGVINFVRLRRTVQIRANDIRVIRRH